MEKKVVKGQDIMEKVIKLFLLLISRPCNKKENYLEQEPKLMTKFYKKRKSKSCFEKKKSKLSN